MDYSLSQQNTLSLSGLWSYRTGDEAGLTAYTGLGANDAFLDRFNRGTDGTGTDFNMDYRLSFKRIITPREHELTAEVRYEQEWEDEFERFTQVAFASMEAEDGTVTGQERNNQEDRNRETSAQIDYVRPLGEAARLEAGYKGSLENLDSDFFADVLDSGTRTPSCRTQSRNNTFVVRSADPRRLRHRRTPRSGRWGCKGACAWSKPLPTSRSRPPNEAFDNDYFSILPERLCHLPVYRCAQREAFLQQAHQPAFNGRVV